MLNYLFEKTFVPLRILKFRSKIRKIKKHKQEFFYKLNGDYEKLHKKLWRPLFPCIDVSWLRFYSNISGIMDERYVPEDLFYSFIERKLNNPNYSAFISDKNFYDIFYPKEIFPKTILKNISGDYYNSENIRISFLEAKIFIRKRRKVEKKFSIFR